MKAIQFQRYCLGVHILNHIPNSLVFSSPGDRPVSVVRPSCVVGCPSSTFTLCNL